MSTLPGRTKKSSITNGYSPVIKAGVLYKRTVIKGKTFQTQNYKYRLFELTENVLTYYEGDLQVKKECLSVYLVLPCE